MITFNQIKEMLDNGVIPAFLNGDNNCGIMIYITGYYKNKNNNRYEINFSTSDSITNIIDPDENLTPLITNSIKNWLGLGGILE